MVPLLVDVYYGKIILEVSQYDHLIVQNMFWLVKRCDQDHRRD